MERKTFVVIDAGQLPYSKLFMTDYRTKFSYFSSIIFNFKFSFTYFTNKIYHYVFSKIKTAFGGLKETVKFLHLLTAKFLTSQFVISYKRGIVNYGT